MAEGQCKQTRRMRNGGGGGGDSLTHGAPQGLSQLWTFRYRPVIRALRDW